MEQITIKDVEHLADLSALEFSKEEKKEFVNDLNNILKMVNQIQEADDDGNFVYNRSHKLSDLREDKVKTSMPQEKILENAPKKRNGCFNVPLVVE